MAIVLFFGGAAISVACALQFSMAAAGVVAGVVLMLAALDLGR